MTHILIATGIAAAVAFVAITEAKRPVTTVPQIETFDPNALTPQQRIDQAWEAMRLHDRGYR